MCALFIDEMHVGKVLQQVAVGANIPLVYLGDTHQDFALSRWPPVASEENLPLRHGEAPPETEDLEPQAFAQQQTRQTRNPEHRPFWQWLEGDTGASLRFRPAISGFLHAWQRAPDIRLLHIFHEDSGWEIIGAAIQWQFWFPGPVPSTPQNLGSAAVGWHGVLRRAVGEGAADQTHEFLAEEEVDMCKIHSACREHPWPKQAGIVARSTK